MLTKTIQGMGASEGIAIGPVFRYEVHRLVVDRRQVDDVKQEAARLDAALAQARQELQRLSAQAQADIGAGEAAIFEAHAMFLDDPELLERVHTTIETLQMNAEYAWQEGTEHYIVALRAIGDEYLSARAMLEASGANYARKVEIGIMVEVPSAALMADVLAKTVDFFSIGTNDLAQYTLAADRTNAGVSKLANALHPSVLQLIRMVIEAAHAQGKWVGLCGELAGNPLATPVLLGLGLDEFSMTPKAIPMVKQTIRHFSASEVRNIAERALALSSATEVRAHLESVAQ